MLVVCFYLLVTYGMHHAEDCEVFGCLWEVSAHYCRNVRPVHHGRVDCLAQRWSDGHRVCVLRVYLVVANTVLVRRTLSLPLSVVDKRLAITCSFCNMGKRPMSICAACMSTATTPTPVAVRSIPVRSAALLRLPVVSDPCTISSPSMITYKPISTSTMTSAPALVPVSWVTVSPLLQESTPTWRAL